MTIKAPGLGIALHEEGPKEGQCQGEHNGAAKSGLSHSGSMCERHQPTIAKNGYRGGLVRRQAIFHVIKQVELLEPFPAWRGFEYAHEIVPGGHVQVL